MDDGRPHGGGRLDSTTLMQTHPELTPLLDDLRRRVADTLSQADAQTMARRDIAFHITDLLDELLEDQTVPPGLMEQRALVTVAIEELLSGQIDAMAADAAIDTGGPEAEPDGETPLFATPTPRDGGAPMNGADGLAAAERAALKGGQPLDRSDKAEAALAEASRDFDEDGAAAGDAGKSMRDIRVRVQTLAMERIDSTVASTLDRAGLTRAMEPLVQEILSEMRLPLNQGERKELIAAMVDDMLGFGPLEPLLAEDAITDIMVNGANQVFVEKGGKLTLSSVKFRDNQHVMHVATRIVSGIGRRVDESSPICDARLPDGSRVNIIIPPLAIDGPSISIRKFSKKKITLDRMAEGGSLSPAMNTVLKIAARSRLNVVISGGTGSGKTTMLNALSRMIDNGERIVTIEDAAELQLQQPHVVRLETRPPNLEGRGAIEMRDLVKNALRMRPDRIILGEVRGGEALDMLQAMNTGHEGSMCTLHANKPREALTRIENMVLMGATNLPQRVIRGQIASAVDLIVQVSRMRDGGRRVTSITEVVGMEEDVIVLQELFAYKFDGEDENGKLIGRYEATGIRPNFTPRAAYFGLDRALIAAL